MVHAEPQLRKRGCEAGYFWFYIWHIRHWRLRYCPNIKSTVTRHPVVVKPGVPSFWMGLSHPVSWCTSCQELMGVNQQTCLRIYFLHWCCRVPWLQQETENIRCAPVRLVRVIIMQARCKFRSAEHYRCLYLSVGPTRPLSMFRELCFEFYILRCLHTKRWRLHPQICSRYSVYPCSITRETALGDHSPILTYLWLSSKSPEFGIFAMWWSSVVLSKSKYSLEK